MSFIGEDWKSSGNQWIRTEFGWKPLSEMRKSLVNQIRHLASSRSNSTSKESTKCLPDDSSVSGEATSKKSEIETNNSLQSKELHLKRITFLLSMRCIPVGRSSSRESNHYSTVSDAVSKMNFHQALQDKNCFPFICKVLTIIFEGRYHSSSGSFQATLLKITDTAKEIAIETRFHHDLVLKMLDKAIAANKIVRQAQHSGFSLSNIDSKIKSLLKMKRQLQECQLEPTGSTSSQFHCHTEFLHLPNDCLKYIISYLSHPKDVLNIGLTNMRLYQLTKENQVWKGLCYYHYDQSQIQSVAACNNDDLPPTIALWLQIFADNFKLSNGKLRAEVSTEACLCKRCNFIFWKNYGHPCCEKTSDLRVTELTPLQFLKLLL